MTEVIDEQESLEVEIADPVTTRELILGLGTMTVGAVVLCIGAKLKDPVIQTSGFSAVNVGFGSLGYFGWRGARTNRSVEAAIPGQPEDPEP